jgi:hypothetical protein
VCLMVRVLNNASTVGLGVDLLAFDAGQSINEMHIATYVWGGREIWGREGVLGGRVRRQCCMVV